MGWLARIGTWLRKGRVNSYWRGDPRGFRRIFVSEYWTHHVAHDEAPGAVRFHHGEGGGGLGASTRQERPLTPWPANFPPVTGHVSVRELHAAASASGEVLDASGDSAAYRDAKAGRSDEAALRVVRAVVNSEKAMALARQFPDAILLPVHAEELEGPNVLPVAYASHLQTLTGLAVDDMIVQSSRVFHTRGRALDRLVSMPTFAGPVQTARPYVLVDDVVASGSTLSALHRYLRSHGGRVVGATVLAVADHPSSGSGAQLAQTPDTAAALRRAFDARALRAVFLGCEIDLYPEELTNSEARNLLALRTIDAVRNRILAARQEAAARQHAADSCAGSDQERGLKESSLTGIRQEGGGARKVEPPGCVPPPAGQSSPKKRPLKKSILWTTPAYLDGHGIIRLGRRPLPTPAPPPVAAGPPADPETTRPQLPFSAPLPPGATRIHIKGTPTAEQALILHDHLFPAAGTYLLTKASPVPTLNEGEALDRFEEWFLDALEAQTRDQFVSAEQAIWDVLDQMLMRHDVAAPSHVDSFELNRALFDLTHASTARIVGLHVPDELVKRLQKLGFSVPEALDFPALAYRMALISQRLLQQPPVAWPELVRLANAVPLSSVERAAIDLARQRAGLYLKPIFDDAGRLWTTTRELEPLRERVAHAIEHRIPVREAARLHGNQQRLEWIARDSARVLRTEIADARGEAAWMHEAKHALPEAKFFRQTSVNACRGCLRLHKLPDGTPRLYTRAEIEAGNAGGVNRGNWREWRPRLGSTHPNCVCSPWSVFHPEMADIFADRAPAYAAEIARLKVFAEAA